MQASANEGRLESKIDQITQVLEDLKLKVAREQSQSEVAKAMFEQSKRLSKQVELLEKSHNKLQNIQQSSSTASPFCLVAS